MCVAVAIFERSNPAIYSSIVLQERENIFQNAHDVSAETFRDRKQHAPWWLPFIMFFAKRFM